jgi:hypothetical protein
MESKNKAYWLAHVVNRFARENGKSPQEAFAYLNKNNAIKFLSENYETEHLENPMYVVEDMAKIAERNAAEMR